MSSPCCPPGSHGAGTSSSAAGDGDGTTSTSRNSGIPRGHVEMIRDRNGERNRDMKVYVTGAPLNEDTRRIVLVYTDVFGIDSGRHKTFADELAAALNNTGTDPSRSRATDASAATTAAKTTTVLVPDFFHGRPVATLWFDWFPDTLNMLLLLPQILYNLKFRITEDSLEEDLIERVVPYLQSRTQPTSSGSSSDSNKNGIVRFSVVGFCFGGWWMAKTIAILLGSSSSSTTANDNEKDGNNENQATPPSANAAAGGIAAAAASASAAKCCCGVSAHPSFQVERKMYGRAEESLMESLQDTPVLLMPAGNDDENVKPGSDCIEILARNRGENEKDISIVFPNMKHGWVVRGDGAKDPEIQRAQQQVLQMTSEFIQKHHPLI